VKQWCLSEACLTGKASQCALNDYLSSDPTLRDEIYARCGKVEGLSSPDDVPAASIDNDSPDDTDVPLSAVIHDTFGLNFDEVSGVRVFDFVAGSVMKASDGDLVAGGHEEDIWAFDENRQIGGTLLSSQQPGPN